MRNILALSVLPVLLLSANVTLAADASVSELIGDLKSKEPSARLEAIDRLGLMGEKAAGAVPALRALLTSDSAAVRAHTAESLGEIGAPAKPAAADLMSLVGDPEAAVRREAVGALNKIRPGPQVTVPLMVKLIEDADDSVRLHAMDALAEMGEPAVPFLIEVLKNEPAAYWACLVFCEIGPDAKAAVPALIATLDDERPEVRREAIMALAAIGPASAPAAAALGKALDDEIDCVPATYALGCIGHASDEVEAKIEANTRSSDEIFSTVSTWALARWHPDDRELVRKAVELLGERLKSGDARARVAAAQALIDLDPDPEISRPIIKKVLDDADPEVLHAILDAMAGLGEKVLPRLIEALKYEDARGRAAAIIARIGPAAKAAVPALIEAVDDEDPGTRNEVLFALAAIGPDAAAAVPAVIKALDDPELNIRYAACHALGEFGPAAMAAKAKLQEQLGNSDHFLPMASAWALCQIDPGCTECAPRTVPIFIKALGEPNPMLRMHAAGALGRMGPLAKDAAGALKKALNDNDAEVREAAAASLEAIGK